MVVVVFRKENEKLTSFCMKTFKSTAAAKKHIEEDAAFFLTKHPGVDLGWIKPKTLDYYCIETFAGVKCYWQYCEL